jgi:hypothetical protein
LCNIFNPVVIIFIKWIPARNGKRKRFCGVLKFCYNQALLRIPKTNGC